MNKLTITLELDKLDKTRIQERTYTNKEGVEVKVREYKLDVVPLKEKKTITEGDTWKMVKTHFVCDAQTKEEREAKADTNFVGEAITFEDIDGNAPAQAAQLSEDEIPF